MNPPSERPEFIVVPHRPRRVAKGLLLPMLVIAAGTVGLAIRAANPDWRGLSDELRGRLGSLLARREAAPKVEPVGPKAGAMAVAKAETPQAVKPEAARTDERGAWDDIRRESEKLKAQREEAERLKEKAAEDLANNPPPPPRRPPVNPNRAELMAEMQRLRAEALREMMSRMDEPDRMLDQMVRQQAEAHRRFVEEFARMAPRGFGPPPGFGNFGGPPPGFGGPLPGMDRMFGPLPGQPRIQEDSGEEIRNGVRRTWRTRVIIMGRS